MDSGAIAYVRQNRPMGLGHAVWCARRLIGNEPFAVLLPDDVIAAETPLPATDGRSPCRNRRLHGRRDGSRRRAASRPTAFSTSGKTMGSIVRVKGMVEKPKAADAPSNLAVIGRYILTPKVLTNLNRMKQGAGGEIQLTDAIAEETRSKAGVFGLRFRGQRYDCGSKIGFLQATVAFGLSRPGIRGRVRRASCMT